MSDQFFWYVTRSAAIVTWISAAASILIGLMTSSRVLGRRPTIPWLVDLHRLFAAMSMTFLGVHMVSLWLDSFVRFRFDDLLIPWVATVPGLTRNSLALGVIAAWLMGLVQVSSLIKDRLAEQLWRSIHLLSYGTLLLGTLHAFQAGSDVDNPIILGLGMSLLTAVFLATVVRLVRLRQHRVPVPVADGQGPQSQPTPRQPTDQVGYQQRPNGQPQGHGDAQIHSQTQIQGQIHSQAQIHGHAQIQGQAQVHGQRPSQQQGRPQR